MILYNTTYHVDATVEEHFLLWIRNEFIPIATAGHSPLTEPRLLLVMSEEGSEGNSFSLQFRVPSLQELSTWYKENGQRLMEQLTREFGQKVVGFTTLLEELDI